MALGGEKQLLVVKLGGGSYQLALGMRVPENWSSGNVALLKNPSALRESLLRDHFATWPQVHTDMIRHSNESFHAWPTYSVPTHSVSWQDVPGITLVGDAAHLT